MLFHIQSYLEKLSNARPFVSAIPLRLCEGVGFSFPLPSVPALSALRLSSFSISPYLNPKIPQPNQTANTSKTYRRRHCKG